MKPSECLKKLLDKKNLDVSVGICTNFEMIYGYSLGTAMNLNNVNFGDWSLYSGFAGYPVPHGDNSYHSVRNAYVDLNKWDKRTKYGSNRYKLLVWLIEQFESKGA